MTTFRFSTLLGSPGAVRFAGGMRSRMAALVEAGRAWGTTSGTIALERTGALVAVVQGKRAARRAEKALQYEEVIIYQEGVRPWADLVPHGELVKHIDPRARYTTPPFQARLTGLLFGTFGVMVFVLMVLYFTTQLPGVILAIFTMFFALLIGPPVGWVASGMFLVRRPFWVLRRWPNYNAPAGTPKYGIEPILHSRVASPEYVWDSVEKANIPAVFRASYGYECFVMRDEQDMLKGGLSTWQKIQIGAMVVLAITMGILVIFFVIATQNPPQ